MSFAVMQNRPKPRPIGLSLMTNPEAIDLVKNDKIMYFFSDYKLYFFIV